MRIRTTRPVFWRSKTIAQLDWPTRLVLKGIESYVDDNGVGKDSVPLICADVFPYDLSREPSETIARVSGALQRLADADLIVRYEINDEALLYVRRWRNLQKVDSPNPGRFPRPDGTLEYKDDVDETVGAGQRLESSPAATDSRDSRETPARTPLDRSDCIATVVEEEGSRGVEESSLLTLVEGGPGGDPPNLPVAAKAAPAARGCRLPTNWRPDDQTITEMRQRFPAVDLKREHEKFTNHWRAQPGAKGRKSDWLATWRNWIIRAAEHAPRNGQHPRAPTDIARGDAKVAEWASLGQPEPADQRAIER
jgi:hypothetical protein